MTEPPCDPAHKPEPEPEPGNDPTTGQPIYANQPTPGQLDKVAWRVVFFNPKRNALTATMLRSKPAERVLIALLCIGILFVYWMSYYELKNYSYNSGGWEIFNAGLSIILLSECCIWAWAALMLLSRTRANRLSGWMDELKLTFLSPAEILQLQCAPTIRFLRRLVYCCGLANMAGLASLAGFIGPTEDLPIFAAMLLLIVGNCYVTAHTACWLITTVASGAPGTVRALFALGYLFLVIMAWLGLITTFGFGAFAWVLDPDELPDVIAGIFIWLGLSWIFKTAMTRVYVRHFTRRVYPNLIQ